MKKLVINSSLILTLTIMIIPFIAFSQELGDDEKNCRITAISPDAPIQVSCVGHGIGCTSVFDCFSMFDPAK